MTSALLAPADFRDPAIILSGTVDYEMYKQFRQQLSQASGQGLIVVELSTLGGDPEVARMMGEDVRYHSELEPNRHFVFLGKAAIYSAGTTFMSFFARDKVLSEQIKHHVKEEERRAEGMFAQAKAAGLDMDALGEKMASEKKALVSKYKASGLPKPPTPSFTGTKLA